MFHVVLDLEGMVCKGFCLLSLSVSQLPNEVANLNVAGLFWDCGLGYLLPHYGLKVLGKRVRTKLIATHLKPAYA